MKNINIVNNNHLSHDYACDIIPRGNLILSTEEKQRE